MTKPKPEQLCYFWDEDYDPFRIGKLQKISDEGWVDVSNIFQTETGGYYKNCRPLTKSEIQKFMEIAPDE